MNRTGIMLAGLLALLALMLGTVGEASAQSPVLGIDTVKILSEDLDVSTQTFMRLGFTLKPGRLANNGVRNKSIRFANGSALELITVGEGTDSTSRYYSQLLDQAPGPVSVSLFAPDLTALSARLDATHKTYQRPDVDHLAFSPGDPAQYIEFGVRTPSPTDLPKHKQHRNGALGLIGIWLADDDLAPARDLAKLVHLPIVSVDRCLPDCGPVRTALTGSAEIGFLSGQRQFKPNRPIVGLTIRVAHIGETRQLLEANGLAPSDIASHSGGSSVLVMLSPLNIWLEFREIANQP